MLPLVEILISVGIFAVAVVLTLQLFLLSSFLGHRTSDVAKAIFEAQNVAEHIKSVRTGAEMEAYFENDLNGGVIYYDGEWEKISEAGGAVYRLEIKMNKTGQNSGSLYNFALELYKTEPYPFIDEKKLEKDKGYIPMLVSFDASKFVLS